MNTPLLELRNATVVRDGRTILEVDGLVLNEGEHVAILGPNGSGKSTLIGLLTRDIRPIFRPEGPCVLLRGRALWDLMEARRLLGVVSNSLQEEYDRGFRVRETVLSGYFGSIGLHRERELTPAMRTRAEELMLMLGISAYAERTMDTLSTGEARRALIARALVHDPAALVLDEPCSGLDPHATWSFLATLRELATPERSLVLVTHHVHDIVPEISRVIMLKDGRIVADGPKSAVMTSERLSALFGFPATLEERDGSYRLW
ncbi:MAG: molybdenum ABC transporter ATP-binding protein [Actinobacteria bacterium HGW-Actinobacteria-6]|jgi:iron complex transport system ATP-binding protein|nr:MAG: molybdenum ABC transporter ATP-binding protein [Actinobacteria bacterium HGW-Actinobacteria-6]